MENKIYTQCYPPLLPKEVAKIQKMLKQVAQKLKIYDLLDFSENKLNKISDIIANTK